MEDQSDLIEMTAGIVSAYVGNNLVSTADLPALIKQVHAALATVGAPAAEPAPAPKEPAVPVRKSITPDYLICLEGVYPHADYVTVTISSPNTKNLRALQSDEALDALLAQLQERRQDLIKRHGRTVPMFVKIAPDLDETQVGVIAATLQKNEIDGVIATNTTIARDKVQGIRHGNEQGGLSGAPVYDASTAVVRRLAAALAGELPIIAAGGVLEGAQARAKIDAGAALVQLYSGLIYRGPGLVRECVRATA